MAQGSSSVLTTFIAALFGFVGSCIGFVFGAFGALAQFFSALPWLLVAVAITALMIPWVNYHDVAIEEAEHLMRGVVYPFWRDTLRQLVVIVQSLYDPLICWFDAVNLWASKVVTDVIYPTIKDCADLRELFITAEEFVLAVLQDLVVECFFGQVYLSGPCDCTNIRDKFIAFWTQWTSIFMCACNDFGLLLYDLPIIPSVPFSAQWADPETWCAICGFINAVLNVFGILLRLLMQLLEALLSLIAPQSPYAQVNFMRPNFATAAGYLCEALHCAVRSFENAIGRFWNAYIPVAFDWTNFLCWLDSALCIGVKCANWVLTLLIHIDEVVQYPTNPFWESDMKPLTLEILNLVAPPTQWAPVVAPAAPAPPRFTMTNYYLDTQSSATPLGTPNPVYLKHRLTECVCIALVRAICDPAGTDNSTANCFSSIAGNLLQGFDFCCATNAVGTVVVDTTSALVEMTYHVAVNGGADFFIFIDRQPFTGVLVDDLVTLAGCIVSLVRLIPDVGPALYNAIVELARYVLATLNYLFRVILAIASLPYFVIQLPGTPEFITQTNVALDAFVAIQERLVADTATSFMNSLCILLNSGFPIPLPPCSNCQASGFIPLSKRKSQTFSRSRWGQTRSLADHVTPLIWYNDSARLDFAGYARALWAQPRPAAKGGGGPQSLPWNTRAEVDDFVEGKRRELFERWNRVLTCKELKREAAELRVKQPRLYRYRKIQGRYACDERTRFPKGIESSFSVRPAQRAEQRSEHAARVTCTPTPTCFDLCCVFRALLQTWAHVLSMAARFFNGFVQYQATQQGTTADFPYFTGEFCQLGRPCFESDLTDLVELLFQIPTCLCNFLTLVIPMAPSPTTGEVRPNLCCAITSAAELVISTITVTINGINALAQANYNYFTMGFFYDDVNVLFDIALNTVTCLCAFTQQIFPLNYIPAIQAAISFDPCCFPAALLNFGIEVLRTAVHTIISLATMAVNEEAFCYFRLDNDGLHSCNRTLDLIGLVIDIDRAVDTLLPTSDVAQGLNSCLVVCGKDQGFGGAVPCICQLFNTLIPWRDDPNLPVSCNSTTKNCQKIDLCCPFVKLGIAANLSVKFLIRMFASLWQPWPNGLPEFFLHYMFCDEVTPAVTTCGASGPSASACSYAITNDTAPSGVGTYTCGRLIPIIDVLTDPIDGLLAACLCELFSLLDDLMSTFFTLMGNSWEGCFCSPVTGTLRSASNVANVILVSAVQLVRLFPLPCYWQPSGISQTWIGGAPASCQVGVTPGCYCKWVDQPLTDITGSWIYQVLGPISNALCVSVGNIMCFVNSVFFIQPGCVYYGSRFLGSSVRWGFELVFRIGSFVEGFIRQFTDQHPTCVGPNPMCNVQNTVGFHGVQPLPLARLITSLLSWPIDTALGDSNVACTRICPHGTFYNAQLPSYGCGCLALSPQSNALNANGVSVWQQIQIGIDPSTFQPVYGCQYATLGVTGNVAGASALVGYNGSTGVGTILPICSAIDDFAIGQAPIPDGYFLQQWPGMCANYSLCRPDNLPTCATNDNATPNSTYTNYQGPVDGLLMGLIRYMACAIPSGSIVFKPLKTIISFAWQLLGGVIEAIVALILFLLSLFNLSGGCQCHDFSDPLQGGGTVHYSQGSSINIGFCYQCPDANAQCGKPATNVLVCEPQCPCHAPPPYNANTTAAVQWCIDTLGLISNPKNWPSPYQGVTATPTTLCNGQYGTLGWTVACQGLSINPPAFAQCINSFAVGWAVSPYNQVNCHAPYCQLGGACTIPAPVGNMLPELVFNSLIGSIEPASPQVSCLAIGLITDFTTLINAFIEIFSTPLITPDSKREAYANARTSGRVVRESVLSYWAHVGITRTTMHPEAMDVFHNISGLDDLREKRARLLARAKARTNMDHNLPTAPEMLAYALWNYDMSDCFTDTAACVCRNIHMPDVCHWDPLVGAVSASVDKPLTMARLATAVSDRFVDQSPCDFLAQTVADKAGVMDNTTFAAWVNCLDKRVQGERVEQLTRGLAPASLFYQNEAPLVLLSNMLHNVQERARVSSAKRQRREEPSELEREFPDLYPALVRRERAGGKYLRERLGITPCDPAYGITVEADRMYYKYQSGYYGALVSRFGRTLQTGDWRWPDVEESRTRLRFAFSGLRSTVVNQPYGEFAWQLVEASDAVVRGVRSVVFDTGVVQSVRGSWSGLMERIAERRRVGEIRQAQLRKRWAAMPIVAWWQHLPTGNATGEPGFLHRVRTALAIRSTEGGSDREQQVARSGSAHPFRAGWQWTPTHLANWRRAARIGFRIYDAIWPGAVREQHRERFLFDSNCIFAERLLNVTTELIDYCVAHQPNVTRSVRDNWRSPSSQAAGLARRTLLKQVDARAHRRAVTLLQSGPGGFNFYAWFVQLVVDLLGFSGIDSDGWIHDVRQWIQNPNTEEADWPDVGLRYWLLFPLRCEWPDNLNCSKGFGLETALIWVSVGMVAVMLAGAFVFPPFLWPFMFISAFFWWLFLVLALGLHYSPRCAFLFPSLTGVSVTLPMCAVDELLTLADKYITNCYVPLLIPPCMVSGDPCPADPGTYIDFINCSIVGVSDGIQNALFLLYRIFGQAFYDFAIMVTTATIGNLVPGLNKYMTDTLNSFKDASGCQLERQWICFGLTAPAIALPLFLFSIVFVAFGLLIPLFIIVLIQLWDLIVSTPLYDDEPWIDKEEEADERPDESSTLVQGEEDAAEDDNWVDELRAQVAQ